MGSNSKSNKIINEPNYCVIIPTYNNASTLGKVIEELLVYTSNIIAVNDGSTDETKTVLDSFSTIKAIHLPRNTGKGFALRKGFQSANKQGYEHVITIDSDGQHMVSDLPLFLEKIKDEPDAIIIGARNMDQENVPGKSSFGNKFSNFWFRFETGIKLPDTQSGYRAYPLHLLNKMWFFTRRFEFEVEIIVRAAWKNIKVMCIPVSVHYAPKDERISHFRPFRDFARISVLNTILVLIAILFIKPFRFMRWLNKKNIKEFFRKYIVQNQDTDEKITFSVMLGIFIGIAPFWGFQMGIAILLALFFKLNKVITLVSCNISIPPMIPVILYLSYLTGSFIYPHQVANISYSQDLTVQDLKINLLQYIFGSFVFAFIMSIFFGLLTFILLRIFRKRKKIQGNDIRTSI